MRQHWPSSPVPTWQTGKMSPCHCQWVEQWRVQVRWLDVDIATWRMYRTCHISIIMPVTLQHHVEVPGQVPVLHPQVEGGIRLLHWSQELRGEDLRVQERCKSYPVIRSQSSPWPEFCLSSFQPKSFLCLFVGMSQVWTIHRCCGLCAMDQVFNNLPLMVGEF